MRKPVWDISWMLLILWLLDMTAHTVGVYLEPEPSANTRAEEDMEGVEDFATPDQEPFTPPNTNRQTVEADQTEAVPANEENWESTYNPDDLQVGCTELRSKRYISDGFCTSVRPITEVVCAGECLPVQILPHYAMYQKVWSREKTREWRCVDDVIRYRNVNLLCQNGERRRYRIPTVRSCKCKRYDKRHNESVLPPNDSRQDVSQPEEDQERAERRSNRKRNNRNQ